MTRIYIAILAFLFPAFLSAQAKTFAGTDYSQGIVFVMEIIKSCGNTKPPIPMIYGYCLMAISFSPPDMEYSK